MAIRDHINGPQVMAPPTAYVERSVRPPGNDGRWADQQITARVPVQESQQDPPQITPISTRFWGIGKTADHAWAHVWQFITLNLQTTPSIQAFHQSSVVPKVPSAFVIDMGVGRQNPIVGHVNIAPPPTGAYGSKVAVQAPAFTYALPANYHKLM